MVFYGVFLFAKLFLLRLYAQKKKRFRFIVSITGEGSSPLRVWLNPSFSCFYYCRILIFHTQKSWFFITPNLPRIFIF
jgi:hypothetical protein